MGSSMLRRAWMVEIFDSISDCFWDQTLRSWLPSRQASGTQRKEVSTWVP